jgi:hypothetical protein
MEAPYNEEFIYEINKKYIIDNNEPIEICKNGFHYFDNTGDIFKLFDEDYIFNDEYRIFEVKPEGIIIECYNKLCCSEITLIKELSFKNLLNYDETGEYTYYYTRYNNKNNKIGISKLENLVIEKDKTGEWCYNFANSIEDANISKLEDAVIEKDKDGKWCYEFACDIEGANIQKLEDAVIEKDIDDGYWCYKFALNVHGANISKLEDVVIEKDIDGEYCYRFATYVKDTNIDRLEKAVIEKDAACKWRYYINGKVD